MGMISRSGFDRRVGKDRRRVYCLEYFINEAEERRSWAEDRQRREPRDHWLRYPPWASVYVGK